MTKFNRVLSESDADLMGTHLTNEIGFDNVTPELIRIFCLGVDWAEQAVLAELAEQEPVATVSKETFSSDGTSDIITSNLPSGTKLYAQPMPSVSPVNDKVDCLSEGGESENQDAELLKQALEILISAAHPAYIANTYFQQKLIKARDVAFKALETQRLDAKERHRTIFPKKTIDLLD